jgi:hypothetical protein
MRTSLIADLKIHDESDRTDFVEVRHDRGMKTFYLTTHELGVEDWDRAQVRLNEDQARELAFWLLQELDR